MKKALQKRKPLTKSHKEKLSHIFSGRRLTPEWREKIRISSIGKVLSLKTRKKIGKSQIGKKHSVETKKKISVALKGELNPMWKGDKVGYFALHNWLYERRGKPTKCEHCDKDGLSGMQIHWANKSQKYKRDLTDWLRLCVSCHKKYDKTFSIH